MKGLLSYRNVVHPPHSPINCLLTARARIVNPRANNARDTTRRAYSVTFRRSSLATCTNAGTVWHDWDPARQLPPPPRLALTYNTPISTVAQIIKTRMRPWSILCPANADAKFSWLDQNIVRRNLVRHHCQSHHRHRNMIRMAVIPSILDGPRTFKVSRSRLQVHWQPGMGLRS
ncbi:hypothetical protein BKA70DRAFT_59580 [Coprinopsis sp. MPI-PUGE-AT-0042]|nr:hypothetical protein BKA70DRAFT_59580 [Coprinopsis sp. MPI-PUGE-AT-0042]